MSRAGSQQKRDLSPVIQVLGIAPGNPGVHDDERSGMRQVQGTGQVVSGPRSARRSQLHQRQATGVLVAGAPGARYRRLHGWPGQARDRRIRPGRGHLPALVLTACAAGLLATLFTAVPPRKPGRKRSALRHRTSRPKRPKPGIPIRGAYQMAGAPASSRYSKGVSSTRRAPVVDVAAGAADVAVIPAVSAVLTTLAAT